LIFSLKQVHGEQQKLWFYAFKPCILVDAYVKAICQPSVW